MILALGSMGIGFASWSDTVWLWADAATGNLAVGIRCPDVSQDLCCLEENKQEGEDIGSISWIDGPYLCSMKGYSYYETMDLCVCNGYPLYAPGCTLEIGNVGTIPAKIESIGLDWSGDAADWIVIKDWTVTFPEGDQSSGSSFSSLQEAVRGALIDTEQTIRVDVQFQCTQDVDHASCNVNVNYCRWNEML